MTNIRLLINSSIWSYSQINLSLRLTCDGRDTSIYSVDHQAGWHHCRWLAILQGSPLGPTFVCLSLHSALVNDAACRTKYFTAKYQHLVLSSTMASSSDTRVSPSTARLRYSCSGLMVLVQILNVVLNNLHQNDHHFPDHMVFCLSTLLVFEALTLPN